jgi:DNA polymerase-3 subunit epsilon
MRLFAPVIAFVDVETTGMSAERDALTELAVVRVTADPAGIAAPTLDAWSTLIDPGRPIPPEIQGLTGITDAMVRGAPSFAAIADEFARRCETAVFVAHNARFDYAFLKHAFARLDRDFRARVLCTVKLSRKLFPEAASHGLDQLIARHALAVPQRHRAMGDATALWRFVEVLYREFPPDRIEDAVKAILRIPSLPPHLPREALDDLPELPGVYRFYGLNAHPLYIGKSRNLRERVGAHFSSDYRSATDLRLSSEIRRIEHEVTAGEIGALLRESTLVKTLLPAHNHALRRKADAVLLELPAAPGPPAFVAAGAVEPAALAGRYGPFSSRRAARELLRSLAGEHALCWTALGLEQRTGPCFARQVRRCAGACVGAEAPEQHQLRLHEALAPYRIPQWPFTGPAAIREHDALSQRTDLHVIRDWCWLGSVSDDAALGALLDTPPRPEFDADITRLLLRTFARGRHEIVALSAAVPGGS